MDLVKHYISASCISFTFSSLFYLLFSWLKVFPPMDEAMIVHMLFISISIICLIFITHQLPIQHPLILRLIELLDVIIVLLVAGAVFKVFPFTWYDTPFIITTGILTYIVVIVVTFMGNQMSATQINAAIAGKKRGASID
ncbi:hypothetical protein [Sporosarcina sp. E16_8]|uniref:hypothetical protein n=1 Tax=Sporosarcina sp. E16_8 TaxID=2789295 RepID=UPI001A9191E1|nr:hypothetical protein [Sporosarcina sp. E16_8]MBO0586954.1 hypothetical protein [Sporosarcina sp. E16_8]